MAADSDRQSLTACPSRPSCVSSTDTDDRHGIAPLQFEGEGTMALLKIRQALLDLPRMKIVSIDDRYLHATQTSRLLRYTDDVEFLVDEERQQIQVRSCARVGYYDFGVNRQRIEQIRAAISADTD